MQIFVALYNIVKDFSDICYLHMIRNFHRNVQTKGATAVISVILSVAKILAKSEGNFPSLQLVDKPECRGEACLARAVNSALSPQTDAKTKHFSAG